MTETGASIVLPFFTGFLQISKLIPQFQVLDLEVLVKRSQFLVAFLDSSKLSLSIFGAANVQFHIWSSDRDRIRNHVHVRCDWHVMDEP